MRSTRERDLLFGPVACIVTPCDAGVRPSSLNIRNTSTNQIIRRTGMKLLTMLLLAASFAVAGCNTMSGFGKDVEKAGDKIEGAADKRK